MIWMYGVLAWLAFVVWGLSLLRLGTRADRDGRERLRDMSFASPSSH